MTSHKTDKHEFVPGQRRGRVVRVEGMTDGRQSPPFIVSSTLPTLEKKIELRGHACKENQAAAGERLGIIQHQSIYSPGCRHLSTGWICKI